MNAVVDAARSRGITEVLHFTTNRGLIGMMAAGEVYSRDHLKEENLLSSVHLLNCPDRNRDAAWTGYVNLSLERVNQSMLGYSHRWHEHDGIWWAVLAFDVEILADPGVWFTTCNNAHRSVKRAQGVDGFEAMFAPTVLWGHYDTPRIRPAEFPLNWTTDIQAEVLFPRAVSMDSLRTVYVPEPDHEDSVEGYLAALQSPRHIQVITKPEIFQ